MAERQPTDTGTPAPTRADVPAASPETARLEPAGIGERIGPYRVLEKLGEGGFGVVYLARQSEPVRRDVALKILKLGMDTAEVIARFAAERQALAIMDHPGVARVFDAGATAQGRPYFVMELVHGVPITQYCDHNRLGVRTRLELFIDVCRAVQHAHMKGIIHRDLKPGNILVTLTDGRPLPKVIDFGIAKAIDRRLAAVEFTVAGQLIGTPAYMSPEQAEEIDIDTRTDVYALGVVLYQLLVGLLPFRLDFRGHAGATEIARMLRQKEPRRASTRVGAEEQTTRERAERRATDPAGLRRELRGDLDGILLKALDKDRSRRYQTAESLAADLRRHLDHQPVLASPPSTRYRLRKFVRRHRLGVLAGSMTSLALVVGLLLALFGLTRATRSAAEAQRAAAEATAVNSFLRDMLEQADPWKSGGRVSILEALDRAAVNVDGAFTTQPMVSAAIRQTIGAAYRALGETVKAEPLLAEAERLRRQHMGAEHPETLAALAEIGGLRYETDDLDEAVAVLVDVIERGSSTLGERHEVVLDAKEWLGGVYASQGAWADAERLSRELLALARTEQGEAAEDTIRSRNNLAWLLLKVGRIEEAREHFQAVHDHHQQHSGPGHPKTIAALNGLAGCYYEERNLEEAERLYRRSLELSLSSFGANHPDTAIALTGFGHLLRTQGRYEEAESHARRALELYRERLGEEHQSTLVATNHYANTLTRLERFDEAEALLLRNLEVRRRVLAPDHSDIGEALGSLGDLYYLRQDYSRAEHYLREAVAQQRRSFGRDTTEVVSNLADLALALAAQGRHLEAIPVLEEVLAGDRENLSPQHTWVGDDLEDLGRGLQRAGRHRRAAASLREARPIREANHGARSPQVAEIDSLLAASLTALGELEEAESLLLRAIEILEAIEGEEEETATAVERLVALYEAWQRPEDAERWRSRG